MTINHVIERNFKINIGQIFEYYTRTFVLSTIQVGGSKIIGDIIDGVTRATSREVLRALAHGGLNGTLRIMQVGKFEHGFLSGFARAERFMLIFVSYGNENIFSRHATAKASRSISSLGGSAMQSYGTSMSTADKIVLSSVIGGTAEALGGGKFANGAVTGAYVMMLNHLMHDGDGFSPQKESEKQKLSLKDKDIVAKLIDEMKIINEKGFKGGNVSDLFDEKSLSFGKNETWKSVEVEYDNSIVTTLNNPGYGVYYQAVPNARKIVQATKLYICIC